LKKPSQEYSTHSEEDAHGETDNYDCHTSAICGRLRDKAGMDGNIEADQQRLVAAIKIPYSSTVAMRGFSAQSARHVGLARGRWPVVQ
jgi:hypothetical protein